MLRPITAGVDGSPESLAAAGWAAREAQRRHAPFRIVHAWEWSPHPSVTVPADAGQRHWAHRILREALDHLRLQYPDLHVDDQQVPVLPSAALHDASAESDLLVLGSRGISGFTGYLVGSVALQVVARAECPVVLVRAEQRSQDEHIPAADGRPSTVTPYRDVVIGIDLDQPCDEVIEFAYEAARVRGAAVRLVHSYRPPTLYAVGTGEISGPELAADREHSLEGLIRQWHDKYPDITTTGTANQGRAASHLLRSSQDACLLVLGRRRLRGHIGAHIGPVTHAAMHHAPCPVAVVPHD
ncbi:universal stress protein [Streptomyces sp. NBC_01167]|uniref:universal stress protein n=1 Tax=Streptomyces sp. NBC_01167 TaxID=2903756 RepID=UPI00386F7B1D|nr:universal stress protein [Streptomyces sp. NBC_01167]